MLSKELIFYFIRKITNEFPEEWQDKLKGVSIFVTEDALKFDFKEKKKEVLGMWTSQVNAIEFFVPSLVNYMAPSTDIYEAIRKIESVVEHELLHAIGMSHDDINEYRKKKKSPVDKIRRK